MAVIRMGKKSDRCGSHSYFHNLWPTGLVSSLPATPEELGKEAYVALCKVTLSEICFLSLCKYFCRCLQCAKIFKAIVCYARKYFLSAILYCFAMNFFLLCYLLRFQCPFDSKMPLNQTQGGNTSGSEEHKALYFLHWKAFQAADADRWT